MARSEERNQEMRDERRRQILSAAVRLFATRGLAATKISDIAAAVGMSHGLLYHYFASKQDIYVDIVRRAFAQMNTAARELERAPQPPRAKLELAATHIIASLDAGDDFAWYSTLISLAGLSDAAPAEAKAIIVREREVPYGVVARIVRAGQRDGSIRPGRPADLALVFWTAVKGLALHKVTLGTAFRPPEANVLTRIFFDGAAP